MLLRQRKSLLSTFPIIISSFPNIQDLPSNLPKGWNFAKRKERLPKNEQHVCCGRYYCL